MEPVWILPRMLCVHLLSKWNREGLVIPTLDTSTENNQQYKINPQEDVNERKRKQNGSDEEAQKTFTECTNILPTKQN